MDRDRVPRASHRMTEARTVRLCPPTRLRRRPRPRRRTDASSGAPARWIRALARLRPYVADPWVCRRWHFRSEPRGKLVLGRKPSDDEAVVGLDPRRDLLPAELLHSLQPAGRHPGPQLRIVEKC